jgi:phage-related protein
MTSPERRPLFWIASSRRDLKAMPVAVQKKFGTVLLDVQFGDTPADAKPLKGFGGAGVLEVTEEYQTNTFRAVYTVTLASGVYVLHVFQKKSKHGIGTPKRGIDLVKRRFQLAREHDARMEAR